MGTDCWKPRGERRAALDMRLSLWSGEEDGNIPWSAREVRQRNIAGQTLLGLESSRPLAVPSLPHLGGEAAPLGGGGGGVCVCVCGQK